MFNSIKLLCCICVTLIASTKASEVKDNVQKFEGNGCDKLIPSFINQIVENGPETECGETGEYPKPGDCTVFFKCIPGRGRILPFLQYCARGYTFENNSCILNKNSTDCPQYNCFPAKTFAEASQAPSSHAKVHNGDESIMKDSSKSSDTDDKVGIRTNSAQPTFGGGVVSLKTEAIQNEHKGMTATAAQKSASTTIVGADIMIAIGLVIATSYRQIVHI